MTEPIPTEQLEAGLTVMKLRQQVADLTRAVKGAPHSYGCNSVNSECCKVCQMDPCSARCQRDDYGGRGPCNCWKSAALAKLEDGKR